MARDIGKPQKTCRYCSDTVPVAGNSELAERPEEDQNNMRSAIDIGQSGRLAQMSSLLSMSAEGSVVYPKRDKVLHFSVLWF